MHQCHHPISARSTGQAWPSLSCFADSGTTGRPVREALQVAVLLSHFKATGRIQACGVLPYSEFIAHEENGILVPNDADAWAESLLRAVKDKDRRRILTGAGALVAASMLAPNANKL